MKKLMAAAVVCALGVSAFAGNVYYVDHNYGSDTNDGGGPGADRACKTIKYVLENLVTSGNGDTVYVAEGTYGPEDGVMTSGGNRFRVVLPSKTTLIATGSREKTFIVGEPDTETGTSANRYGGPLAVRCCNAGDNVVRGFTFTGGHSPAVDNGSSGYGSGFYNGTAIDCIITNNFSSYRAGGALSAKLIGCYLSDNTAGVGGNGQGGTTYNCIFGSGGWNTGEHYNDTIIGTGPRNGDAYNCLYANGGTDGGSEKLHRCVLSGGLGTNSSAPENDCLLSQGAAKVKIDATTYKLPNGHPAIDFGNNDYYVPKFPKAVAELAGIDYNRDQRIFNGTIDVGAVEYDWRDDFAHILAPSRLTVEAADPGVVTNDVGGVTLPADNSLSVLWVYPAGGIGSMTYHFEATLADGATLHVKRVGSDEDLLTVTSSGKASFVSDQNENLVFTTEGGDAQLANFGDVTRVSIEDASTGLDVTGVALGVTEILPGSSVELTVARNFATAKICTGILVNGEFFAFEGETADNVWTKTVAAGDDDVRIVAVYAEHNDIYVDASVPDDSANGFAPYAPKRTLAAASALATAKGDVIHAAPGVYSEGAMKPMESASATSNRVNLAAGVGLVGAGADVTVIEGRHATHDADKLGNGPDALRCVYCGTGAYVRGFTLRGGATNAKSATHDNTAGGGGIRGGAAIDCVVTNNVCGYRGGNGNGNAFIRCTVSGGTSFDGTGGDANGCSFHVCNVTAACYDCGTFVNCTLWVVPGANPNCSFYNCLFACDSLLIPNSKPTEDKTFQLYNCIVRRSLERGCSTNLFCRVDVRAEALKYDDDKRPLADSLMVDAGDWTLYTNKFPAAYIQFATTDWAGGPRKIGEIDVGCGEFDWRTMPTTSGLDFTLVDNGDGTSTLSVKRNYTSEKLTTGFTYGDTVVAFADHEEGYVWTKTLPTDEVLEATLRPVYAETQTDWYVDAVNGNDSNKGYSPMCARKTLVAAMALAKQNDTVHAAPGTYDQGEYWHSSASNRVYVGTNRGLVADQGPAVTEIVGHSCPTNANGIGPDAVRCVKLDTGAWIQGFTIRGGRTPAGDGKEGGGILNSGGCAVDCEVTDCACGYRGQLVSGGTYIRCYLHAPATGGSFTFYMSSCFVDCVMVGGAAYTNGKMLNCLLGNGVSLYGTQNGCPAYNSFIWSEDGGWTYTNCHFRIASLPVQTGNRQQSWADENTCRFYQKYDDDFNADFTPKAGAPVIDAGDRALYDAQFPSDWVRFKTDTDFGGGQRVYNGQIDIGAREYDWRATYAKALRGRAVEVLAAGEDVKLNAEKGVDLKDGDAVKFACTTKTAGKVSFKVVVAGEGEATVTYGETVLEPSADGVYEVEVGVGTSETFEVSFAGTGTATVSGVDIPHLGSLLLVR